MVVSPPSQGLQPLRGNVAGRVGGLFHSRAFPLLVLFAALVGCERELPMRRPTNQVASSKFVEATPTTKLDGGSGSQLTEQEDSTPRCSTLATDIASYVGCLLSKGDHRQSRGAMRCRCRSVAVASQTSKLTRYKQCLVWNGAEELTEIQARALAAWSSGVRKSGGCLHLPTVTRMSPPVARALSSSKSGGLVLPSLQRLDTAAARALVLRSNLQVELDGLREFDAASARALVANSNSGPIPGYSLSLNGLNRVSEETARGLGSAQFAFLSLDGLEELDAGAARALSAVGGGYLQASRLKQLSTRTLWELCPWGRIILPGIKQLDTGNMSSSVPKSCGILELDGLEDLNVSGAKALATWPGPYINLKGVKQITAPALAALARFRGSVRLRVTRIDVDAARVLVSSPRTRELFGGFDMSHLIHLDAPTARVLATGPGSSLDLGGLRRIDPATARALAAWQGPHLRIGADELGMAVIRELASWQGSVLQLDATKLGQPELQILARWGGSGLLLARLRKLGGPGARALAAWKGKELHLPALTQLQLEEARALASWRGEKLHLRGLESPKPSVARALVAANAKVVLGSD